MQAKWGLLSEEVHQKSSVRPGLSISETVDLLEITISRVQREWSEKREKNQ